MSTVRLTEERLRTWALAQEERERMCLGVLALDPRFSDVTPRRPKGGPDGGRDIEGIFDKREVVWGAVGFRANAIDSAEDKTWVTQKIKTDIASAKTTNPQLWGFVFFTNVDLTPGELRSLEQIVRENGLSFVEIFYRERLRIVLDSPRGLALRYQYLGISLSEPEQAAFFAEYGSQLESLIHRGFSEIDERLRRIEFFHECGAPLRGASVIIQLKHDYSPHEFGHFRFLAQLINLYEPEPHPTLWIGGRDAYPKYHSGGQVQLRFGSKSLSWSRHPDERIHNMVFSASALSTNTIEAGAPLHKRGPFKTLGDLDRKDLSIYVTKPLYDAIAGIYFVANDYVMAGAEAQMFSPLDSAPLALWPEALTPEEQEIPWLCVMLKSMEPPAWLPQELARQGWGLDFSNFTPQKVMQQ
jgi:hypothetical protein